MKPGYYWARHPTSKPTGAWFPVEIYTYADGKKTSVFVIGSELEYELSSFVFAQPLRQPRGPRS